MQQLDNSIHRPPSIDAAYVFYNTAKPAPFSAFCCIADRSFPGSTQSMQESWEESVARMHIPDSILPGQAAGPSSQANTNNYLRKSVTRAASVPPPLWEKHEQVLVPT